MYKSEYILSVSFIRYVHVFLVRRCTFNLVGSFEHAQNLQQTLPGKGVRGGCIVVARWTCSLFSHAYGHFLQDIVNGRQLDRKCPKNILSGGENRLSCFKAFS